MKIKTPSGHKIKIDDEDFKKVSSYRWFIDEKGYARARKNRKQFVRMHRLILDIQANEWVDHINGDRLDNRKSNLRPVTAYQNRLNSRGWSKSGYKGVSWIRDRYYARIRINGKLKYLGYSSDPHLVAHFYNEGARKYFGKYAKVNKCCSKELYVADVQETA